MQAVKASRTTVPPKATNKLIPIAFILVILIVFTLYINNAFKALQATSLSKGTVAISQSVLEEKYGLRVNLIALTAAGGIVDLRIKFIDSSKASLLLQDKQNFPALWIADSNMILNVPEETKAQEIKFEKDGGLYLLFPNTVNAVKPGTPVTIVFGDNWLEPILSR